MLKFALAWLAATLTIGKAWGEEVAVKGRGLVDLEEYVCAIPHKSSSLLSRICYQDETQHLLVEINGLWFEHCKVPKAALYNLMLTDAVGGYYNAKIRPLKCRPEPHAR